MTDIVQWYRPDLDESQELAHAVSDELCRRFQKQVRALGCQVDGLEMKVKVEPEKDAELVVTVKARLAVWAGVDPDSVLGKLMAEWGKGGK